MVDDIVDKIASGEHKVNMPKNIKKVPVKENPYSKMSANELSDNYIRKSVSPYKMYPVYSSGGSISDSDDYSEFKKMVKDLVTKEDEELMRTLYAMRKKLFQHRTDLVVSLYSEGNIVAMLKAHKYLYSHGQQLHNYFMDQSIQIDYGDFKALVERIADELRSEGCGGIGYEIIYQGNKKVLKVDKITYELVIS
jgi:hypothetical protein